MLPGDVDLNSNSPIRQFANSPIRQFANSATEGSRDDLSQTEKLIPHPQSRKIHPARFGRLKRTDPLVSTASL
jgi:hypothetical protein